MALSRHMRKPSRIGIFGIAVSLLLGGNAIYNSMEASRANEARERVQTQALVNSHNDALEQADDQVSRSTAPTTPAAMEPIESTLDDVPLMLHKQDANGNVTVR